MGRRRDYDHNHHQQEQQPEGMAHEEGANRFVPCRPSSRWTTTRLFLVLPLALLLLLGLLLPAAAAASAPPAPSGPSSPPLINAHMLLTVRVAVEYAHLPASTEPTHLSLRLSCSSPSMRLTQNNDAVLLPLLPPHPHPSLPLREPGVTSGVATAEVTFKVEMARAPRQCRVSAFDNESGARVGTRAVTLPGAGSDDATDALLHVELPLRLGRQLRRHNVDIVRTVSFILRAGRLALEAMVSHATLCLRQLCRWELQTGAAAAAGMESLAWAAAASLHAALTANLTGVPEIDGALRFLTAADVLVLLAAALPITRRRLLSAFAGAAGGQSHKKSTRFSRGTHGPLGHGSGGSGGATMHDQEPPQHEQQCSRRPFVPAHWHCVMHDRAGGASRMEERALASLADAVTGGARSAAEATIGDVVGRLLNHRVGGMMLSYKGQ